jgi:Glycosyltransferase Family 4
MPGALVIETRLVSAVGPMNNRLTILLTNIWLADFAGSEVVVHDLAVGLLHRGHRPIVYSPKLGDVAKLLISRGVSVIDDLRELAESPDIIHAHHSIPCGEALLRFPQVPAIYVCHAFEHWVEAPVHFPQIGAYVAVDEACRDRLVHREGIDPQSVVILHNAVDLRRIRARPMPLRDRPARAIAFAKAAAVPELRVACEQLGIEYHVLGATAGRVSPHPEQELMNFDLVFASARGALEGLCCGCAVIVCDYRGFAGLVTSRNFEPLRAGNFGLRCLVEAVTVDRCIQEIGRYDVADAALVTKQARLHGDLEKLLDGFENLYFEVLSGVRRPRITPDTHQRAVARFLHENLPRRPNDTRWPWIAEREHLRSQIQSLETTAAELSDRLGKMDRDRTEMRRELGARIIESQGQLAKVVYERDQIRSDLNNARSQLANVKRSRLLSIGRLWRRIANLPIPY